MNDLKSERFRLLSILLAAAAIVSLYWPAAVAQEPKEQNSREQLANRARLAMQSATKFMHQEVAVHGGYVYQVSADLALREGEGVAAEGTVWVQPPGTPTVGQAFLEAYQRTGEKSLLDAARDAAHCLVDGQLHSGGWQAHIDFDELLRSKQAYRIDGAVKRKAKNISTFDDDKTQSAVRFLAAFDSATQFSDAKVHSAVLFALNSILANQFPNGGFAQVFEKPPEPSKHPVTTARYPESWPREYPGGDYWWYYTLNDNNVSRIIDTLLLAADLYQEPRYREAALKTADFLLLAQMPEPQPAWAQQYNFEMQPVWARKFEPPAISGSESQEVLKTLMMIFEITGDRRYLEPIPRALNYLKSSQLEPEKLARFYELQTNRPLFMNTKYQLTYEPDDLPTHYGFLVKSNLESLERRFEKLSSASYKPSTSNNRKIESEKASLPSDAEVLEIVEALDIRGAWIERGPLRYHKRPDIQKVIKSETFVRNLNVLSRYLAK